MRVVQLVQQPLRRGGEIFARQLGEELRQLGHECRWIYLYDTPAGPDRLDLGAPDTVLGGNPRSRLETTLGIHPLLLRRLRATVQALEPDVLQLNGARAVKYGAVLRRLGGDFATVYRNIGNPDDWIRDPVRRLYYERVVFPGIDAVAAVAASTAAALERRFARDTPIEVIPTGVSEAHLTPKVARGELRRRYGAGENSVVVLFVGRLAPEKRLDRLIDAVTRVRHHLDDVALWIVGDGPERQRAEEHARAAGIDARFCGAQSDVASHYFAADIVALTSDTEGVPAVLLEAGYAGLPVVATDVGAAAECVREGVDGLLVPPEAGQLADALERLARDPETRKRMGSNYRARVRRDFTMTSIARRFDQLYERAMSSR